MVRTKIVEEVKFGMVTKREDKVNLNVAVQRSLTASKANERGLRTLRHTALPIKVFGIRTQLRRSRVPIAVRAVDSVDDERQVLQEEPAGGARAPRCEGLQLVSVAAAYVDEEHGVGSGVGSG
ncbi:hypothetical protein LTR28_003815 [Elasticomyces elasticus]|nr:hypothetical protein LTR28_003815 [Elasticomyces elasticus]